MEKKNFKSKKDNVVINFESYEKLPTIEKDGYYLTAEDPTHKVEVENNKPFIAPIISEEETKGEDKLAKKGETPVGDTVAEKTTETTVVEGSETKPETKKGKVKGEKN